MMRYFLILIALSVPPLAPAAVEQIAPPITPPSLETLFPGRLERIAPVETARQDEHIEIVVAVPFLAELSEALCRDTGIIVKPALQDVHIPMDSLPRVFAERESEWIAAARTATACVTMRSVWPVDPLYPLLRRQNIRVVEIDATRPLDGSGSGIALLNQSREADAPPYVWLHPGNALRMAEFVAADLAQLAPAAAPRIRDNLAAWREPIVSMQNQYHREFAAIDQFEIGVLSSTLDYLFAGFDLPVVARLDGASPEDIEALAGIPALAHEREPTADIARALEDIGVRYVILDPLWHWPRFEGRESDTYLSGMSHNLERLVSALRETDGGQLQQAGK